MATKERAAHKAVTEAREQLDRRQSDSQSTGDGSEKCGAGRPPKEAVSLEHAEPALDTARREYERLAQQLEQVKASIGGIGHDYQFVDLERGVRRNGQLIAADIQEHIEPDSFHCPARRTQPELLGTHRESRAGGAENASDYRVRLALCRAAGQA